MHGGAKIGLAAALVVAMGVMGMLGTSRDRADMVARHNLSAPEVTAYDSCISAIAKYRPRNVRASKPEFCACIALEGAKNLADPHKHLAGPFVEAMVEKDEGKRERLMKTAYSAVERAGLWNPPAIARTVGSSIETCVGRMLVDADANEREAKRDRKG